MLQLIGTKKCNDTKKAIRFFKERKIKYQWLDLDQKELSPREFDNILRAVGGLDPMIDDNSKDVDTLALLQYLVEKDRAEKLFDNQHLIKTPILRYDGKVTVGYCPEVWKKWTL